MFVKVTNGTAEKYTLGLLRRENPNVSFPKQIKEETLVEYDVYPVNDTPQPQYNRVTQTITESFTESNGAWYRTWVINDKPAEEVKPLLINNIAAERYNKEGSGLVWTDSAEVTWFLDTTQDSQARITGAKTAVDSGIRLDNGVWKCYRMVEESYVLAFRPTTNAEISEWSKLVHDHVQKCFAAEAISVSKVNNGDYTVSFNQEFDLL